MPHGDLSNYFALRYEISIPYRENQFSYLKSDKASWGCWLAWAKTEAAACCKIFNLVNSAASIATSTSLIRDSAEAKFSLATVKLLIVTLSRDSVAPSTPRVLASD